MTSSHISELVARLAGGWGANTPCPPLDEFLSIWREQVAPVTPIHREADRFVFRTYLPEARLRGGDSIHCTLLGAGVGEASTVAKEFATQYTAPGRLLFFFCLTEAAWQEAGRVIASERCVMWRRTDICEGATSGLSDRGRALIRQRVPLQMLIPYDITVSANGPMFFGRRPELNKLLFEDGQSFAVTGPGRIGKTSLVKRVRDEMRIRGEATALAVYYIDFFECADKSPDSLARKIALEVEPSPRGNRTNADGLAQFLEYQRHRLGRVPLLIFDEVDEICSTALFREQLAVPLRHQNARFIIVGRGGVLRLSKDSSCALSNRLRVIRLGEIDTEAARRLLQEPIRELGLDFENFERTFELVCRQTGRSPHMIQFYGQRLVELAAEQSSRQIKIRHVDQLKWDFQTACFFLAPLNELKRNPIGRLVALCLLKASRELITPITIQEAGRSMGLEILHDEAVEIGDTLVIQNLLTWADGGCYRLANEALPEYAGKMGYLSRGLEEARQEALRVYRSKAS